MMNTRSRIIARRAVDIGMMAVIVILLGFQITGQAVHEWMGITMSVLVIIHTVMNHGWYRNIFKGKYPPVRILQTVVNLALLVSFVLTAVSGMMMSQHAVPFLRSESLVGGARAMHLAFSHWSFLLISAHLGLHWNMMTQKVRGHLVLWRILSVIAVAAGGYGLFLTVQNQIYSYLFFQVQFAFLDYGAAPALVFFQNILMIVSWALIAYEIAAILRKPAGNDPHRRRISLGMIAAEFAVFGILLLAV